MGQHFPSDFTCTCRVIGGSKDGEKVGQRKAMICGGPGSPFPQSWRGKKFLLWHFGNHCSSHENKFFKVIRK